MKHAGHPSLPPDAPELVARIVDELDRGLDVTMVAREAEGCALLDEVAGQLSRGRTRVIRVAAPGGLDLAGLLTRLSPAIEGVEQTPEQGIKALTRLDPSCSRIVLLVSSAETLERNALRAIQLAAEAQPKLRLVFAGAPALLDVLEHPDRRLMHDRLSGAGSPLDGDETRGLPNASRAVAAPPRPALASDTPRFYKIAAAGLGILATVGLVIFVSHTGGDTATATRLHAAQPARADMGPDRTQAAQAVPHDPPQTLDASRDAPPPPASPGAESAQAPHWPQLASIVPPVSIQPPAPGQPPAAAQQASLSPPLRHREPTPRRLTAPTPRYASRPPAGADAQPLRLQDHPAGHGPDPYPLTRLESRQEPDGDAWQLPADEPRGAIGTYSGGPGGIRSFRPGF